ncbi:MAG: hypothetical protein FWD23_13695 [Oscillospiraceae bacterium]|nr:hypothetical protein [Oscillospiraceae bacterium]
MTSRAWLGSLPCAVLTEIIGAIVREVINAMDSTPFSRCLNGFICNAENRTA